MEKVEGEQKSGAEKKSEKQSSINNQNIKLCQCVSYHQQHPIKFEEKKEHQFILLLIHGGDVFHQGSPIH